MTKNETLKLQPDDRLKDTRDGVLATVLSVDDHILRVRYDDSLSSNYVSTDGCSHFEKVEEPQFQTKGAN